MEPGVPFALLGAVQVLLVVATAGLAAAAGLRRTTPGVVVAVGALVLAGVEIRTALRLGFPASDDLALLRAAATLMIGAGLWTGGLGRRRTPSSVFGIVVPLGATGGPSAFAAASSVVAAVALLATRRDAVASWVAGGFGLWAVAAGLASRAEESAAAAQAVIGLRGAGGLAVLIGLTLLAQFSLLSKVVSAILAGVVAMAIAAVGVVGNVVVDSYDRQTRDTVANAAQARVGALVDLGEQAKGRASLAPRVCPTGSGSCRGRDNFLRLFGGRSTEFLVRVRSNGTTEVGDADEPLSASTRIGLSRLVAVQEVLRSTSADVNQVADVVRLTGARPGLAVVGVAAGPRGANRRPAEVWVFGTRIDDRYAGLDLDRIGGLRFSVLSGDPLQVTASNLTGNERVRLLQQVQESGVLDRPMPRDGVALGSQGTNPTVGLEPVRSADNETVVGLLAMTRDPSDALRTERDALRLLIITALVALLGVALVAVLLGRRTVLPVRRLTAAAERVAAGDLDTRVGVSTRDEVGTLSRTFDAMTSSLGQATEELRDYASRLGTVLSSMTDGLLATDGDGVVTSVNPAALAMLGLDEADVLGEELEVVADVRSGSGESLVHLDAALVEEPGLVHRPDGSEVPVRVALLPLEGAEGVVLILRDTTREREVERMKTEFLSNVSHELRTPLTPIRGYAEILVSKQLEPERVVAFATTIRDESLKMNRVVDLLVDVASIEAGRVHVMPRDVPVRDLLDARLAAWQTRAPVRARDLRRRVAAKLPPVHVDPVWVGKALDELLDNAVKYTPPGTPITLVAGLSPDGSRVRVAVRDAGPGISAEDQDRLFTSFEQVDGSATRKVGGLGLGLSFVRRLSEDAGFPLTVSSTPGKGSEFALDLPVA